MACQASQRLTPTTYAPQPWTGTITSVSWRMQVACCAQNRRNVRLTEASRALCNIISVSRHLGAGKARHCCESLSVAAVYEDARCKGPHVHTQAGEKVHFQTGYRAHLSLKSSRSNTDICRSKCSRKKRLILMPANGIVDDQILRQSMATSYTMRHG